VGNAIPHLSRGNSTNAGALANNRADSTVFWANVHTLHESIRYSTQNKREKSGGLRTYWFYGVKCKRITRFFMLLYCILAIGCLFIAQTQGNAVFQSAVGDLFSKSPGVS
jgi:hypothetical protein